MPTDIKLLKELIKQAVNYGEEDRVIEYARTLATEANINDNLFGSTNLLMLSSQFGLNKVVENLLENYKDTLDLNHASIYGTALFLAVDGGHPEIVNKLIQAGIDVNSVNKKGATALGVAEQYGQQEIIDLLTAANAQSLMPQAYAETINSPENMLRRAIEQRREGEAIEYIDKMDINQLNSQIAGKSTAVMFASYRNCPKIVQALLNKGVDTTISNNFGDAMKIAQDNGHHDIVNMLDVNVNAFGETIPLAPKPPKFPKKPFHSRHIQKLLKNNTPNIINQKMITPSNLRGSRPELLSSVNTEGPYDDIAKGVLGVAALGIVGYKAIKGASDYLFGKGNPEGKNHQDREKERKNDTKDKER